jgi:dTDP-4-dehydrorhamnose reductase
MKALILGDGLLGSELVKQTGWDCVSRKKNQFDLTQPETFKKFLIGSPKWDVIINCIANTDTYSPNKEAHWAVNYKGTADLTDFCNEQKIKLVHISTDYVYTNSKHPASEADVPVHGQNWYSYTKVLAEAYVELKSHDFLVIRTTHKPTPFPYPKAWTDQIGNFDYVDKIASLIIELVKAGGKGIFNLGTETKSIFTLAQKTNPNVLPANKPENVPGNTSVDLSKLKAFLKL